MLSLKKVLALGMSSVLLAVSAAGCGNGDSGKGKVFRVGTANASLCLAGLHMAEDKGYFEEEFKAAGIEYELVEIDVQQTADLVASDKLDACVGLAGGLIPQIDNGLDISFVLGMHTGCTKYYAPADSDIKKIEDVKGKKIGVPGVSDSSVIALKRKLFSLGIGVSPDNMEIELVPYNLPDLPLALANGAVDAIALHDPVATAAEQEYEFTKILDTTEDELFNDEYCCAAFVTNKAAKNNPEASAAYTRALLKGCAYVQAHPDEAVKLQIENNHCSGDPDNNTKILSSFNYQPSVSKMESTFRNTCDDLSEIGDLKTNRDLDQFTADHFKKFDNVPDSYIYNEDGSFTEADSHNITAEVPAEHHRLSVDVSEGGTPSCCG